MAEKSFPVIIFRFSCSLFEQSHAPLVSYVSVNFRIRIFFAVQENNYYDIILRTYDNILGGCIHIVTELFSKFFGVNNCLVKLLKMCTFVN